MVKIVFVVLTILVAAVVGQYQAAGGYGTAKSNGNGHNGVNGRNAGKGYEGAAVARGLGASGPYGGARGGYGGQSNGYGNGNGRGSRLGAYGGQSAGGYYGGQQGGYGAGAAARGGFGSDNTNFEPANYEFEYDVSAPEYGVEFGHAEQRQGEQAWGQYKVVLPDGRRQVVDYTADEEGYKPTISYEDLGGNGYGRAGNGYGSNGGNGYGRSRQYGASNGHSFNGNGYSGSGRANGYSGNGNGYGGNGNGYANGHDAGVRYGNGHSANAFAAIDDTVEVNSAAFRQSANGGYGASESGLALRNGGAY